MHTLADLPAVNAPEHDAIVARIRQAAEAHTDAGGGDLADAELRTLFAVLRDVDATRYIVESTRIRATDGQRAPRYAVLDRWAGDGDPVAYRPTSAAAHICAAAFNDANAADEAAALTTSLDEYLAPTR